MNQEIALHEGWNAYRKIAFRFFFIFFLLFILPYPINQNPITYIPGVNWLLTQYGTMMNWMVQESGNAFFGVEGEISTRPTGSGDRTYNWVQNGLFLCIAIMGCLIWSVLDRKRKSYAKLWKWFYILMVYNLAYWMFVYGLIKVFSGQFGPPGIGRLLETFGESSPMRIMWTFMGSSVDYTHFSGWSETIAGILLLFRRTRTLGALAAAEVMLNVFMMNMSYDVPVKLFSFRLMIAGAWIALADHKRLLAFFLFNKPVAAQEWKPFFKTRWKNYTLLGFQVLIMGWHIYNFTNSGLDRLENSSQNQIRPELYGIHDVSNFVINGDTLPPLTTDTVRWQKAFVDYPSFGRFLFGIRTMQNETQYLRIRMDSTTDAFELRPFRDTVNVYRFDYIKTDSTLTLDGIFRGDTLHIETEYFDPDDFIIRSRGFHWLNEVPYNRHVPYKQ